MHLYLRSTLAFVCCLLISFSLPLPGQTGNGSIQGTVRDSSQAVVPNATVLLEQVDTGRQYKSATNATGYYLFASLPPGDYSISVEFSGMEKWKAKVLLQTGQTAVMDAVFKVGGTATAITVTGDLTPLVTTTSASLANVVERERIEQLPLNGRFLQSLVMVTTPGLEGSGDAPRVFGLRDAAMEYVQDGAVLDRRFQGTMPSRPPGLDTVNEFGVETSVSSAKLSRPATTVISTKSGANRWHGGVFYTARNNGLGVARRREDYYDKPPELVRNEFGASLGGPVHIPRLYNGRNRTFFFASWEEYRLRQSTTAALALPTAAMRQGDFSGLQDGVGRRNTLYDPWTTSGPAWQRLPFAGNVMPANLRSPVGAHIFNITPAPTLVEVNPMAGDNYFGVLPSAQDQRTYTVRIDHRLSEKDQVFGRYTTGKRLGISSTAGAPTALDLTGNVNRGMENNHNSMLSWTHLFSPIFFMETIGTGASVASRGANAVRGGEDNIAGKLGLPNPLNGLGLPNFGQTGFDNTFNGPKPEEDDDRTITVEQNFTRIQGKHQFELGWRFRKDFIDVLPLQEELQGSVQFNSGATALYDPATGSAMGAVTRSGHNAANVYLGVAAQYLTRFGRSWYHIRNKEYSGYFQDNWKVSPSLTLNLGLRYEYFSPYSETGNQLVGFDPGSKSIVLGLPVDRMIQMRGTTQAIVNAYQGIGVKFTTPDAAGLPGGFIYPNRLDFNPRAGFAYNLKRGRRSVALRGGFGMYRFTIPVRTFHQAMRMNPPFRADFQNSITEAARSPDGKANYGMRSVPTIIAGVNSQNAINMNSPSLIPPGSFNSAYYDPHQPTSTAQEWNLTLETEIHRDTLFRVGYVGTHGYNLEQFNLYNQAPNGYVWYVTTGLPLPAGQFASSATRSFDQTTYGQIEEYKKSAWSNFNGLQLEVRRRFSKGIGYQLFYVLSNALGTGTMTSTGGGFYDTAVLDPAAFLPGAVPLDYDARNRFLNYQRDTAIPHHRIRWNFLVDLPFGRGKKWPGSANAIVSRILGGWQLAGFGSYSSRYWALPAANWGAQSTVETYGTGYPIQDCRSGRCIPGYLYYNGYIPANRINSTDAQGRPNGVMGVPESYRPAHQPLTPVPANGGGPSDPNYALYETNTVFVPLKNGNQQRVNYNTNLHPWRNQYRSAPWTFNLNASLFKSIPLTERVNLRLNADFFNVLNNPGLPLPNSASGILSLQNSANAPRQLQLTLRLAW